MGDNPPDYYRHAVYARNTPGLTAKRFAGKSVFPDLHMNVVKE